MASSPKLDMYVSILLYDNKNIAKLLASNLLKFLSIFYADKRHETNHRVMIIATGLKIAKPSNKTLYKCTHSNYVAGY